MGATARPAAAAGPAAESSASASAPDATWPALALSAWRDTYATLHMWTQIVSEVRMALSPALDHWWATALYVNPRGLTTSSIPGGTRTFEVAFDFLCRSTPRNWRMPLRPRGMRERARMEIMEVWA